MAQQSTTSKLVLLGSLYVSQYIPIVFFTQAIPVFMRQQGMSLETIGLIGILGLPWVFKFLWSPFIDRIRFGRWGHYRVWIIGFQCLLALSLIICAFLNIQNNFNALLLCMFLTCLFASSQDIATDALAVNLLDPREHGWGNGIQSAGNFLGAVIGGGVMLVLLGQIGWRAGLLSLAVVMLLCLIPVLWHQEASDHPATKPYLRILIAFFRRPKTGQWLLILLLYMAGFSMAGGMLRPLMVDRGLSLEEIGWILGVVSFSVGMVGALIAGALITQWGRKRSLIRFSLLQAVAILTCCLPAIGFSNLVIIYLVCILVHAAQGMTYTALLAAMMNKSELATAGTDYTIQVSLVYFSGIAAVVLSGAIAQAWSYPALFMISAATGLISVWVVARFY